jgi:cyclic pyranopterin phosphate synthase
MASAPLDKYRRKIDYLRLSITDRCNLQCIYCMPSEGVPKLAHADILTYEEIVRLANIAVKMGMTKIRITGGEPLARKDAVYLCENIAKIPDLKSLSLTTNGVLLARHAQALFDGGIRRINISLDTLQREKFAAITRHDRFEEVWHGIETAMSVGFSPVKLNTVVMRGVNDDEIEALGRLTYEYPFHVRFIEFMPFQPERGLQKYMPSEAILSRLSRVARLTPVETDNSNGPALHFAFPGARGKIGIISPVSAHFCPSCNRLRLTADGKLRGCLFADTETDLRTALRSGASDDKVVDIIKSAIAQKPEKHKLESAVFRKCVNRAMVSIGG